MSNAFKSDPETFWKACQWERYGDAANQSWSDVSEICEASVKFISDHLTELTADNNMPLSFQDLFESDFSAYSLKLELFGQRLEEAKNGTENKLIANNELYHILMNNLCLTGQYLFEDSPAKSSEYSYEAVSTMFDHGSPSAVAVRAMQDIDGVMVPMANVDVSIVGTDIHESTNAEGAAEITRLSNGALKVRLRADGFEERIIDMEMDGTRKMLKVVMIPLFEGEMKVGSEAVSQQTAVNPE